MHSNHCKRHWYFYYDNIVDFPDEMTKTEMEKKLEKVTVAKQTTCELFIHVPVYFTKSWIRQESVRMLRLGFYETSKKITTLKFCVQV